jgi:hypothetical protein
MPTLSRGIVAELTLPEEFKLGREFEGGTGSSWLKSCHLNSNEAILISLFYRGTRIPARDAGTFRRVLETPAMFINNSDNDGDADETELSNQSTAQQIVAGLGACLGNAYNNQIINNRNGNVGPRFYLNQMEVREVVGKNVLSVSGYFHDYGGMPESSYIGLFVDASPADNDYCQIQEIIFEAPDEWQFKKHLPTFLNCLGGIKWASAQAVESKPPRAVASNKALLNLFADDKGRLAKTTGKETDR